MPTVCARDGAGGGGRSQQRDVADGVDVVFTVTVTVIINGLVKLSAFNAHICPSKYLASFWKLKW